MNTRLKTATKEAAADAVKPSAISAQLAEYTAGFGYDTIPAQARERAKLLILDALGIALASTHYDFAHRTLSGLSALAGSGDCSLLGLAQRLPLRDAVLMNGVLVHGLDYDDTHIDAIIHPTASALPCAFGVAEHLGSSGRDMLAAYILGVEVVTRIGMAAKGGFHHFGFHPSGIAGHFSCALQAGWLLGLNARQLTMAQGIVGSTAAASQEFLAEGAWNKRMHPGWAGVAGITAAYLARGGFIGPSLTYEGRFALFKSHLHEREAEVDYAKMTAGLGNTWEVAVTAIKPYPICHLIHACADAALELKRKHNLKPEDIEQIQALLPQDTLHIVAEPEQTKLKPANSYDAKFSTQFVVAACLVRGHFGLAELENDALSDARILALAQKVKCSADPDSTFPKYFSGGVVVKTRDGRELKHHEPINRGAGERALSAQDIEAKFMENAQMAVSATRARALRDVVLSLDTRDARDIMRALAG
jgi:2-methylcitrate dehydratase PrpD